MRLHAEVPLNVGSSRIFPGEFRVFSHNPPQESVNTPAMEETHHDRTMHAMGERVAVVETKLGQVERDTANIRSTLHGINGEISKSVLQEARRVIALEQIVEQTRHLPEIVAKVAMLDELKPPLLAVIAESQARKGAWRAYAMMGTAAVGALTMMGIIGSGVVWMIDRMVGAR